jgi:hypothetical protein
MSSRDISLQSTTSSKRHQTAARRPQPKLLLTLPPVQQSVPSVRALSAVRKHSTSIWTTVCLSESSLRILPKRSTRSTFQLPTTTRSSQTSSQTRLSVLAPKAMPRMTTKMKMRKTNHGTVPHPEPAVLQLPGQNRVVSMDGAQSSRPQREATRGDNQHTSEVSLTRTSEVVTPQSPLV